MSRKPSRKRKPSALRLVDGTHLERVSPKEPRAPSNLPDPPSFLNAYALEEWNHLGPILHKMGVLTVVDGAAFGAYCMSYALWRQAEEDYAARPIPEDDTTHGMVKRTKEGNHIQNPLLGIANAARRDMVRFACEYGLTPSSRARLEAKAPAEDDNAAQRYFGS